MRVFGFFAAVCFVVAAGVAALAEPPGGYPSLRDSFDPDLQEQLERSLEELGLTAAVADKKLGVALVDISDLDKPRVASVNGDKMMYAASLPKIAILLSAFVQVERGEMTLDDEMRESLTAMIRRSSNVEATRMLNRVGRQTVLDILQSDRFDLYDPSTHGGLWIGKEYGSAPAYQRDPLHNLSHGATALKAARFYYLLETGRMLSPELTREMKAILSEPAIEHKFVKGLKDVPGVRIYRKSGSWRQWHADSAIVEDGGHKYIAVALAEHPDGGRWLVKLIGSLHRIIVEDDGLSAAPTAPTHAVSQ